MIKYSKRLIEMDLPIKRISEHARNEKNLRKGHPWHLHIWWARRPWGACRAVELASLLPAPIDEDCPESFVLQAYVILSKGPFKPVDKTRASVQESLLKFVGEFSCWELGAKATFWCGLSNRTQERKRIYQCFSRRSRKRQQSSFKMEGFGKK